MDRVFVAEFEVARSSFVGRSLADSRHATLLLFLCRGRDVSCVDFVSIIHPDYRPEPIRAAILYRSALITIRRRRAGSDLANAAPHSRIFGTDWNPTLRRDFARSRIIHNFWSIESSITKSLSFFFKVIFKSVSRAATKIRATKSFVWKINISAYHFLFLLSYRYFQDIEYSIEILLHAWIQ